MTALRFQTGGWHQTSPASLRGIWLEKDQQFSRFDRKLCLITWGLTVTLNLKTANQSSCMTLWPMMIWLQKVKQLRGYRPDEHLRNLELFCDLDLDHNRAIQSFHQTVQLMMMCHQTMFSCKRISSSEDIFILESHILILWSFTVTLTLKTAIQSFWKTIWLMTFWNFAVTLNTAIQFLSQDTPVYDNVPFNHVWLQKDQQFRRYIRVIFWSYDSSLWH